MNRNYRFNRPIMAIIVIFSPLLLLAAGLIQGLAEAVDVFRREVPDAFRWSILEPLEAAYVALGMNLVSFREGLSIYAEDVRYAWRGFANDLSWLKVELSRIITRHELRSWYWTREAWKEVAGSFHNLVVYLVAR